jgi:hypothetical protein
MDTIVGNGLPKVNIPLVISDYFPFTAELASPGVSSQRGLLSLLGPTTYCRGGIRTLSYVKDRRLHTG